MTANLGNHAIVVGAGMGGLAAAAALAPSFTRVTILDRSSLTADIAVRLGAGQGAHTHQLLKGGEDALERLLPGFTAALQQAGGVDLRMGLDIKFLDFGGVLPDHDAGFSVTALSRPAYEALLRGRVAALPNVTIRDETPVKRFIIEAGRCTGLELETADVLSADLVADATGMTGPLAQQLAEDGHARFETENIRINVAYTTGRFAMPPEYRGEKKGFFVLPGPPSTGFGLLLPIENNEWILSLGARGANPVPRDLPGFLANAKGFPASDIYDRIRNAELRSDLRTFRKTFVTRRRFDTSAAWPARLIPIGDTFSSVNPTYGQGMTVAALQADTLANLLAAQPPLDSLASAYLPAAFEISDRAWGLAINSDYVYAETEGERPPNFPVARAMASVLRKLCETDPDFITFRYRLGHMLDTNETLRSGPLAMRFFAALQGAMAPQN
jgi:2-polyprenyl-6-methoxyphenol hydroxylase-like FAD-dependent oxidoreductase